MRYGIQIHVLLIYLLTYFHCIVFSACFIYHLLLLLVLMCAVPVGRNINVTCLFVYLFVSPALHFNWKTKINLEKLKLV